MRALMTASTASHIRNFHLPYLRAFRELGWDIDVACGGDGEDIPGAGRVISLPFAKKITAPENFRAAAILRREMTATAYDLVIAHTSLAAFFTRRSLPKKGPRPKVVNMVHGYLFDDAHPGARDRLLIQAEKLTAPRTDLVLTMNARDLDTARRLELGARVAYVPGVGVDFARLDPGPERDKAALRRAMGIPENAFVLLYPAEFSKRKNQALLLQAMTRLPERAVLVLAGQGALWQPCRELAKKLGVEGRVVFPGQVPRMGPWYALADAGVSASWSEGLPFNVMEAMYAALPVAATAVKGHTDLLTDGKTGLLFPPGDPEACAGAIRRLMDQPQLGQYLGQAARQAAAPYSLERVLPRVMEEYLSLVPALAGANK